MPGDPHWFSGQWLSEVALAGSQNLWGPTGPTALRYFRQPSRSSCWPRAPASAPGGGAPAPTTAGFPRLTRTRQTWALIGFLCGAWVLMGFAQERPQQVSFIAFPLVGLLVARMFHPGWLDGLTRARMWCLVAVILTTGSFWAQCHQGWLLAAFSSGCRPDSATGRVSRRLLLISAAAMTVTCSPHGWGSVQEHSESRSQQSTFPSGGPPTSSRCRRLRPCFWLSPSSSSRESSRGRRRRASGTARAFAHGCVRSRVGVDGQGGSC